MIRPFTCVCMILAAGSGLYVYQTKHRGQMLDKEIARTIKASDMVRQRIIVLRSEWAVLNEPDHLAELARSHLALHTTATSQLAALSDLGIRLPAPLPPGTSTMPTDEGEDIPSIPVAALPPAHQVAAARLPLVPSALRQTMASESGTVTHTPPASVQTASALAAHTQSAPTQTSAAHAASSPALVQVAAVSMPPSIPPSVPASVKRASAIVAARQASPPRTIERSAEHSLIAQATPHAPAKAAPASAIPANAIPANAILASPNFAASAPASPVSVTRRSHILAPVVSVAASAIPSPVQSVPIGPVMARTAYVPVAQVHPGFNSRSPAPEMLGASALGGARSTLPAPVPYASQAFR